MIAESILLHPIPNTPFTLTKNHWEVTSQTGDEINFNVTFVNAKDKKTELEVRLRDDAPQWYVDYINTNKPEMSLYNRDGTHILDDKDKPIVLKWEKKCGEEMCYYISLTEAQAINIWDYIKIGENSIILEYNTFENGLLYEHSFGNVTLKVFAPNHTLGTITTEWDGERYKMIAEHTGVSNDTLRRYNYTINSTSPMVYIPMLHARNEYIYEVNGTNFTGEYDYTQPTFIIYDETQANQPNGINTIPLDFNDICKHRYSDCIITYNNSFANIEFTSYSMIDPYLGTNVSACGILNIPNKYYQLNKSISYETISACIVIANTNITFDGNGFYIHNNRTNRIPQLIVAIGSDIKVINQNLSYREDITISTNAMPLYLLNSYHSTYSNITTHGQSRYGVNIQNSWNNTFNNYSINGGDRGVYIQVGSDNNTFNNLDMIEANRTDGYAVVITSSDYITWNGGSLKKADNGISLWDSKGGSFTDINISVNDKSVTLETGDLCIPLNPAENFVDCAGLSKTLCDELEYYGTQCFWDVSSTCESYGGGAICQDYKTKTYCDNSFFCEWNNIDVISTGTFLNVSYNKVQEEVITPSNLTRKWWYQANTTDTLNNPVENINISIRDKNGLFSGERFTDANGLSGLFNLTDYTTNGYLGNNENYKSNYTIYANGRIEVITSYNVTSNENNYNHLIELSCAIAEAFGLYIPNGCVLHQEGALKI